MSLWQPQVRDQWPRAGVVVPRGSVVMLTLEAGAIGAPAVPKRLRASTVPSFLGRSPEAGMRWADARRLDWAIDLPPLRAGVRPTLPVNYRVVRQTPAQGAKLRRGKRVLRTFRPTPLMLVGSVD